jgi:hypothetical protein
MAHFRQYWHALPVLVQTCFDCDVPPIRLGPALRRAGLISLDAGSDGCGVTTVQRINTQGGKLNGVCDQVGKLRAAPYAADYVFLRKN